MKKSKILAVISIVMVLYCSMATLLTSEIELDSGLVLFVFIAGVYFFRRERNIELNNEILFFLFVWFVINYITIIFLGAKLLIARVLHYYITLILLPLAVLYVVGEDFWERVEKIVYTLTLISIPLFILNVIFISTFDKLGSVFHPLTYNRLAYGSYWSALVYVNSIKDNQLYRNSGFMWEPGAFAFMIIWGLGYHWIKTGLKYNKKFFVYFIALITTFSTAGYFAIFVLMIAKYMNKIRAINIVVIVSGIFLFVTYIYSLDFMGREVGVYLDSYSIKAYDYDSKNMAFKGNRFVGAYFDILDTQRYPLGYGIIKKEDFESGFAITGVSGLSSLLKMWGIPMFIYLMIILWRYYKHLNSQRLISTQSLAFIFTAYLIMMFSNPLDKNTFTYLMVFTPLVFRNK